MRSIVILMIIVMLLCFFASSGFADDPARKMARGVADIAVSPFELFKGIEDAVIEKGVFGGVTVGTLQGISNTLVRAVKGVYTIITFPMPSPEDYTPVSQDK